MLILPTNLMEKGVKIRIAEIGWRYNDLLAVIDYLMNTQYPYVILGGDVLYLNHDFTYNSWAYNIDWSKKWRQILNDSFEITITYVNDYVRNNGDEFFFTMVVSDLYTMNLKRNK